MYLIRTKLKNYKRLKMNEASGAYEIDLTFLKLVEETANFIG